MARRPRVSVPKRKTDALTATRQHADTWYNLITGLGVVGRDASASTQFGYTPPLDPEQAVQVYEGDPWAQIICDAVPRDAMRQPITLVSSDGKARGAIDQAQDLLRQHGLHEKLLEAAIWGRVTGGAAVLLVTDDGELEAPLDVEAVTELQSAIVVDRRALWVDAYDLDPESDTYGEPLMFKFWPQAAGLTNVGGRYVKPSKAWGGSIMIHRSRLVLFGGAPTSRVSKVSQNQGWDDSVLRKVMTTLAQTQSVWQSVPIFVRNTAQAVMRIQNLKGLLAAGGEADLVQRLRLLEQSRAMGIVPVDAEREDFTFAASSSASGGQTILQQSMQQLAGVGETPVTRLLGMSPGGLNATGESDARFWYDRVDSWRVLVLKPAWEQVLDVAFQVVGGKPNLWEIVFPPLWSMTDAEQATIYAQVAQADSLNVANRIATPPECGRGHFSPQGFRVTPQVDLTRYEREEAEEAKLKAAGDQAAQDTALNGAQVTALLEVVRACAAREIPRETAVETLLLAFPLDRATAEKLVGSAGKDFEAPVKAAPAPFGGAPEKPKEPEEEAEDPEADARLARLQERLAKRRAA